MQRVAPGLEKEKGTLAPLGPNGPLSFPRPGAKEAASLLSEVFMSSFSSLAAGSAGFPSGLSDLGSSCPSHLWVRGSLLPGDLVSVAVVGSRSCSSAGLRRAARLGRLLGSAGVCVVSGLARGVDGAAHAGCLAGGGRSVAVLGTGLSHCFPACHAGLASRLAASGAVLSSFLPSFRGSRSSFVLRNGLVAALSQVLVVVEAREHSGTASAVRAALSLGRPVGLLSSLVASAPWAARLARVPGVFVVSSVECVVSRLSWGSPLSLEGVA